MRQKKQADTVLWGILFGVYCLVMLRLLLGRRSSFSGWDSYPLLLQYNTNLIPFFTIGNYLQVIFKRTNDDVLTHCIINLVGNVALFIPAGIFLPALWSKLQKLPRFLFTCFLVILLVETVQLFTLRGSFDVDDIILNLFGMLLGFIAFHIFKKPSAAK